MPACEVAQRACTIRTQAGCAAGDGSWLGQQSPCGGGPGNLITCCTANFNGINGVTMQDLYDYFVVWNASAGRCFGQQFYDPSSDVNGDTCTTVQDLYDFLTKWSAGCP